MYSPASLYELLSADQAEWIADRLEIHSTPKHGSRLNMAKIEFSVVGKRLTEKPKEARCIIKNIEVVNTT
jgi:hypothetical protein